MQWNARHLTSFPTLAKTLLTAVALAAVLIGGCGRLIYRFDNHAPVDFVPNPIELPPADDDFVWSQVIDAVDDYFRVASEQPVQNSNGIVLDGRVETSYRIGASLMEPWRKDSTSGFERLQSTLQSIRRRAIVTVRPGPSGYLLEVIVQKDLEDTDRSQFATESSAALRHDGTVVRHRDSYNGSPQTLGWIPLGRDTSLEQKILQDIHGRVSKPDRKKLFHK